MADRLFITATGTGIGKTLVTAALAHQLGAAGRVVRALKPVISGFSWDTLPESDTGQLLQAQGLPLTQAEADSISPLRFEAPLSPDMAARREGREIDPASVMAHCRAALADNRQAVLIEGVGGVMVPLTTDWLVLDWIKALNIPAVLVAGTYLGTLSHTLTAVTALRGAGAALRAIVLSESDDAPVSPEETRDSLAAHVDIPIICIPRMTGAQPWQRLPNLLPLMEPLP